MIGLITQEAIDAVEKARKRRERECLGQESEAVSAAHAAAEGFQDVMAAEPEAAPKSFDGLGPIEGPPHPVQPGDADPGDYRRGYIEAGHAAPSPQHGPPVPHIDLTGSVGRLQAIHPSAPSGPWGER